MAFAKFNSLSPLTGHHGACPEHTLRAGTSQARKSLLQALLNPAPDLSQAMKFRHTAATHLTLPAANQPGRYTDCDMDCPGSSTGCSVALQPAFIIWLAADVISHRSSAD